MSSEHVPAIFPVWHDEGWTIECPCGFSEWQETKEKAEKSYAKHEKAEACIAATEALKRAKEAL